MRALALFAAFFCSLAAFAEEPFVVKYIGSNPGIKEDYYLELIDAALKATEDTHGSYRIAFSEAPITSKRKREMLLSGDRINIDRLSGFPSQQDLRQGIIKVNYPLLHNMLSYRVPLIKKGGQVRFDNVKSLRDLRNLSVGMGQGWEGDIYKSNGFNLVVAPNTVLLLKMLVVGRYDFLPLSAVEIEDFYKIDEQVIGELVSEKNLLICSPLPVFFYVSASFPLLAERLRIGLEKIDANGQEDKIFEKYFSEKLKKLNLSKRIIFELQNPENDGTFYIKSHAILERY